MAKQTLDWRNDLDGFLVMFFSFVVMRASIDEIVKKKAVLRKAGEQL